jgi:outer membrane protein
MFINKLAILLAVPAVLSAQTMPAIPAGTFRPITLAEALRLAKENNVAATTSANSIRSATNAIRTTRAQLYYPNVSMSAGQSWSAGDRIGQSGTLVPYEPRWAYNTGISANLTLFDGGKTIADLRQRRAEVQTQEAGQVATMANVSFQVKVAYNQVLSANEAEAAARAQLAVATQNLAFTVAKVNAGAANVADSLNSVVTVGNAQLAILNAQQLLRQASATLTRWVSTPDLVTAAAADTADLPRFTIDSAAIMTMALDGPNVRQLQSQLVANQASQRSARAGYLPSVSTNLGFSGNGTKNLYGLGGDSPYPYSRNIGFNVSYPLFNRYQRENSIQTAQINAENTQAQLRDAKLQNQQTVITQIGLLRNAEQQMVFQQVSVRAAEEALRVNQQRYSVGVGTFVDVLTSQSNVIVARQGLITARLNYRNARAQIEALIGRDLQ